MALIHYHLSVTRFFFLLFLTIYSCRKIYWCNETALEEFLMMIKVKNIWESLKKLDDDNQSKISEKILFPTFLNNL